MGFINTIKDSASKLKPYLGPSYENASRFFVLFLSVIVIPVFTIVLPSFFLKSRENSNNTDDDFENLDITKALLAAGTTSIIFGIQKGLTTFLQNSVMQKMRKDNLERLKDSSDFLMYADTDKISSLQYVTVGQGPKDFCNNSIPFITLPMYITSTASTLGYIWKQTGSVKTAGIVLGVGVVPSTVVFLLLKGYVHYLGSNQIVENKMMAKTAFIQEHRESLVLMGANKEEIDSLIEDVRKIAGTTVKLGVLDFVNFSSREIFPMIASQFLGGYYKGLSDNLNYTDVVILNTMIMVMLANIQHIVEIFTHNYTFVKINILELKAFDAIFKDCKEISDSFKNLKINFLGEDNKLAFNDLTMVYPASENSEEKIIIKQVTLEIDTGKIYRICAASGVGKSSLLKAISGHAQYVDGEISFPIWSKDSIMFIPQHSFIALGSLVSILTYPNDPTNFYVNESTSNNRERSVSIGEPLIQEEFKSYSEIHEFLPTKIVFYQNILRLLSQFRLVPDVINESELDNSDIDWNERLSGGEKQKIGIIRAIMSSCRVLILDEATSALDTNNKDLVYDILKGHCNRKFQQNFLVLYTEHNDIEGIADGFLNLVGETIEYQDSLNV